MKRIVLGGGTARLAIPEVDPTLGGAAGSGNTACVRRVDVAEAVHASEVLSDRCMNATPGRASLLAACASISLLSLLPAWLGTARSVRAAFAVGEEDVPPAACVRSFDAPAYQEAQECFAAHVAKQPADATALFYLGRSYYERRQPMPAIEQLKRAGGRAPGRSDFHDWLGRAYGIAAPRAAAV